MFVTMSSFTHKTGFVVKNSSFSEKHFISCRCFSVYCFIERCRITTRLEFVSGVELCRLRCHWSRLRLQPPVTCLLQTTASSNRALPSPWQAQWIILSGSLATGKVKNALKITKKFKLHLRVKIFFVDVSIRCLKADLLRTVES